MLKSTEPNFGKNFTVSALAVSMVLGALGASIPNVALPNIAADLSQPFDGVKWVVSAYLVSLTVSAVGVGYLGDRFGLRPMLLFGLALFSTASLLCALSPDLWSLVAARVLQGVAAAFLMTMAIALVNGTAKPDRVGRVMGLLGTMSAIGTAAGPAMGGFLIAFGSWSSVFLVMVPLGLFGFALTYFFLPVEEGEAKLPKLQFGHLVEKSLMPKFLANLLISTVMMATLVIGPFYLGITLGLDIATVGMVMSVGPLIASISGVPSGRLVDRWGAGVVVYLGLAALSLGAFGLAILPAYLGLAGYLAAIAILTPGYQLFLAAINTAVMRDVDKSERGTISGMLTFSRNLGLATGASGLGFVFDYGMGQPIGQLVSPAAVLDGMQLAFATGGLLVIVAIVSVRVSDKISQEPK